MKLEDTGRGVYIYLLEVCVLCNNLKSTFEERYTSIDMASSALANSIFQGKNRKLSILDNILTVRIV